MRVPCTIDPADTTTCILWRYLARKILIDVGAVFAALRDWEAGFRWCAGLWADHVEPQIEAVVKFQPLRDRACAAGQPGALVEGLGQGDVA